MPMWWCDACMVVERRHGGVTPEWMWSVSVAVWCLCGRDTPAWHGVYVWPRYACMAWCACVAKLCLCGRDMPVWNGVPMWQSIPVMVG